MVPTSTLLGAIVRAAKHLFILSVDQVLAPTLLGHVRSISFAVAEKLVIARGDFFYAVFAA